MNNKQAIKKQKKVADYVLEQVAVLDERAIVAGGAPRDWDEDKPAKDIDVYLYVDPHRKATAVRKALEMLFGPMNPLGSTNAEFVDVTTSETERCAYDSMDIRWVFEGEVFGEQVQFIFMQQPTWTSVINEFDCSICRIWYKNGTSHPHVDYVSSRKTKMIYVKDPEGRQNNHLKKMYERYAFLGYKFTKSTRLDEINGRKMTPWTPVVQEQGLW